MWINANERSPDKSGWYESVVVIAENGIAVEVSKYFVFYNENTKEWNTRVSEKIAYWRGKEKLPINVADPFPSTIKRG